MKYALLISSGALAFLLFVGRPNAPTEAAAPVTPTPHLVDKHGHDVVVPAGCTVQTFSAPKPEGGGSLEMAAVICPRETPTPAGRL